jgi:hypothetical protein
VIGPVEWFLRRITGRPKRVPDPHRIKLLELVNEAEFHAERARMYRDIANAHLTELVNGCNGDTERIDAYARLRQAGVL